MLTILLLLAAPTNAVCASLDSGKLVGRVMIMPPTCKPARKAACAALRTQLFECFRAEDITTSEALRISQEEQGLSPITQSGRQRIAKVATAAAARYLVLVEVPDAASAALVRIVDAQTGEVLSAAHAPLAEPTKRPTYDVRGAMDMLGEKLARSLAMENKSGRVAIMPFTENGELVKKNGLGNLVAAELTVRFRRDHQLPVVERNRLDAVLKEFELAQYGLIDAKNAPTLGGKLDAKAIVIGQISEVGAMVHVVAQVVDVQTALVVTAESVEIQSGQFVSLASDAVVLRTKGGALYRSLILPGWGQQYNRQPVKGALFTAGVLLLGGGAVGAHVGSILSQRDYDRATPGANFDALVSRIETWNIVRTVALALMGVVWVANVIDAYVSGTTFDSATGAGTTSMGLAF